MKLTYEAWLGHSRHPRHRVHASVVGWSFWFILCLKCRLTDELYLEKSLMTLADLVLRLLQKHLLTSFSVSCVPANRVYVPGRLGHMSSLRRLRLDTMQ